jgi:hypothetical protein
LGGLRVRRTALRLGAPSGTLLDASPQAASAAAIAWIATTAVLAGVGLLVAQRFHDGRW